jgi:putative ABC transport system permease protein
MPPVLGPLLLAAVLAGSVVFGLAASDYPAWQAAHVEVLEVLRNE